jgi:hypothetical protein
VQWVCFGGEGVIAAHNVSLGGVSYYILVLPMMALLLLLAKPLRPVIILVFAIALTFVLHYILLSRIVLLTDGTSDFQTLAQVAELAWAQLPPESPNGRLREPVLTILNSPRSRKECRLALFRLLLRASDPLDSGAGHDVANGFGSDGVSASSSRPLRTPG